MVVAPHAGDDGDHAGALEMEIKGTRRKGYTMSQFFLIACDVYPCRNLTFCLDSIATVA